MDCVLAYDLGTSGVKAVLVQKDGSLLATATENYPLLRPAEGWAEQRPEDYWSSVCRVTHGVLRKAGMQADCVAGIAFGTLWKGIIPVSSHGEVLHNSILWLDSRAAEQAKRINAHFPGVQYRESDYWPKLLWLRENRPEVIEKAEWILEVNAFLKWKSTGIAAVDMSNSYLRSLDGKTDSYYKELLEYMDIPREKIPPVVHSTDLVGYVTPEAAEALGVLAGTPVFGGNNDIQGVCVGAGCSHIGGTHAYLGSSGWIGFTLGHGTAPANSPFDESRDILIASTRAACLSLNWVVSNLYHAEQEALGDAVFEELEREMAAVPPGAEGLLATPWLYEGKGQIHSCFLNLKATHTRGHMARAVLESVCYQLRQLTQHSCKSKGQKWPEKVIAVGGGATGDVWMQILADVLGVPVAVPVAYRHAGAIGTAYSALIGLGICDSFEKAGKLLKLERQYAPDPNNMQIYNKKYDIFTKLRDSLEEIGKKLEESDL